MQNKVKKKAKFCPVFNELQLIGTREDSTKTYTIKLYDIKKDWNSRQKDTMKILYERN